MSEQRGRYLDNLEDRRAAVLDRTHPAARPAGVQNVTSEAAVSAPGQAQTKQGVMDVETEHDREQRCRELEERVKALEEWKLSVIMTPSKQFWIDLRRDFINICKTIAREYNLELK